MATHHSTMSGLWLESNVLAHRRDLPRPRPGASEALVRVLRAGICSTDLEMIAGYAPFSGVLGHEFVGRVERGPEDLVGQRVVGEINLGCGSCPRCAAGEHSHCLGRRVLGIRERDRVFAELVALPVENLHRVPAGVESDVAVFVEPLAAALRIGEQVALSESARVLVVGDGKLGQLVARALQASGCQVTVLGRHGSKLDLLEQAGIETTQEAPAAAFPTCVDCTGNPDGFDVARATVRPGGTLVLKSTYTGRPRLDASQLVVDEIRVVGSRCGPFAPALHMLRTGLVDVTCLITARYPLEQGLEAIEHARRRGSLKILLDVSE